MDTNNSIELRDENIYPDEKVLRTILGKSYESYSDLLELYDKNGLTCEWRYYRDGKAWLCKVQKKKKTIVWMSAWRGFLKATMYFPQKHLEKLCKAEIDEEIISRMMLTKNVGKLKPCTFEIRDKKILKDFEKVMHLKIEGV